MGTAGTSGTTLPEFIGTSLFKTTVTATSTMYAEVNLGTCSDTTYVNRVDCENASGTWTPSAPGAGYYEQANRGLGHYSNTSTVAPGTAALRPTTNCGSTGSIQARIADCVTQNTTRASWDGGSQSTSGLGTWSLVSRIGASKEVWRDNRTGFLWSSVVSTGINWCRVTGNTENIAGGNCTPGAGTDCNGVACQPASPQSACFEGAGLSPTDGAEVWATGTYSAAKGEMGLNSATKVRWRAPLFRDYMIARYNGLEFVMPDWGGAWYGSLWGNNYLVREDGFGHALGGAFGNGSARCVGR